ncbi:MFS monocarboxylate transporter-like protein [Histoplasma capsulatum G186AR]|uniref:Weak homology to MFS monocarboxylate transporters n=1 Tax=Ajellomyces capsulatus TaxID=5037 RepID=A0A8H8D5T2_AJECA|nr:weak homology to MFS monocarboxylate transporters [Histoplasma capsulatum]QSS71838.1 MFS monocarboxylate transporter-like protein [Histoplasma capsulatum G186AR]
MNRPRRWEFYFMQIPQFWVLALSNLFQGFAIYVPSIYLPTFATLTGVSPRMSAFLLSAFQMSPPRWAGLRSAIPVTGSTIFTSSPSLLRLSPALFHSLSGGFAQSLSPLPASSGCGPGAYEHVIIYMGSFWLASSIEIVGDGLGRAALRRVSVGDDRSI